MKNMLACFAAAAAIAIAATAITPVVQVKAQAACLHGVDEAGIHQLGRQSALLVARQINAAQ